MDISAGRYYALRKSFRNAIKCLHGVCSREVVKDAFPSFTDEERERVHRLLINVMRSVHDNILEEFEELCQQEQVDVALEKIDEFIEMRKLDQLPSTADKTRVETVEEKMARMKKDEIEFMADSLKKVEESNNAMKARIEQLKKAVDSPTATDAIYDSMQFPLA